MNSGQLLARRIRMAHLIRRVRPFTMIPDGRLAQLAQQIEVVLDLAINGNFVECGVWRGGAAFLMAELMRRCRVGDRKVWLLDSFQGLPAPEAIDGGVALSWSKNTEAPGYFDNCRASLEEVQASAAQLGLSDYTKFVKGWFEETLPSHRNRLGPIALLHLDCDWYASVRTCLDNLYDQVVDNGFVLLDDYYVWDGCAIAVHEFFTERRLPHRIEGIPGLAAFFRKR